MSFTIKKIEILQGVKIYKDKIQYNTIHMSFDYPLRTKFLYLRGIRCYLLDYLGRGGYENEEYSFHLIDSNGHSYLQNHSLDWLVENIENDSLIVRTELPSNLLKQIQEYAVNVKHLACVDLPDDLKNMVKVYLGNVSYNKLFGRKKIKENKIK